MRHLYLLAAIAALLAASPAIAQTVNRRATLNWTAPTACSTGAALSNCPVRGYSIQKRINNVWTEIGTTAATVTTYVEQNLALGTHLYRVLATSDAGPSAPSNEVSKVIDIPGAPGSLNVVISVTVTVE